MTQAEVAAVASVTATTIRNHRDVLRELESDSAEIVPPRWPGSALHKAVDRYTLSQRISTMDEDSESISHLSADDIRTIHELIVEANAETTAGVASPGDVEYVVEHVQEGHFGQGPESVHEKAFQLLRLIAANHPFVDGNKRTALMSTRIFYAVNGLRFDYDREIKEILKALATDESSVDADDVLAYLRANTEPLAPEYEATINLWLSRIEGTEQLPSDPRFDTGDDEQHEPNDYDDDSHSKE